MNLKVEIHGIKLEIQNGDLNRVERTLLALFSHIEGKSFVDTYNSIESEERPVNSKRNFVEEVNGIKILNGIKHYKCAYKCMCGKKGKKFIKENDNYITCHSCSQILNVLPSTANDLHDEEYNYFIAY